MTRETITVNARAQWRLYVLNHILAGETSAADAAGYLGLSLRQVRRLLARYRTEGIAALVHGNAGRTPSNRLEPAVRGRLVELATTTYAGVNRQQLAELLAEREDLGVAARTLRRVLAEAGLPPVRTRRPRTHHLRRERMSSAGMLLQVDGSRHDWLEGRGPWLTLVGGIDDATGEVTGAIFREQEDAHGYLEVLCQTGLQRGLPLSLYSDRHGIFWKSPAAIPSLAEQFAGRRPMTQLGKALEAARIAWIAARSPQAKGRIERLWGTLQDRLRSELRLAGADTLEDANRVLGDYLPRHNARFGVAARDPGASWRAPDRPVEELFCFRHSRVVARDGTFSLAGRDWLIVDPRPPLLAARRLVVQERLDHTLWVELGDTCLPATIAPPRPATLRSQPAAARRPASKAHPPQHDHPWRRYGWVRTR
jgi:transposase